MKRTPSGLYAHAGGIRPYAAPWRNDVAMGFNAIPIITSILVESTLLAFPGALLGAFIAWLSFNGNFVNSGTLIFKLTVTPHLLALGIGWALAIGVIGGSLPALRAARLPVAVALRAG